MECFESIDQAAAALSGARPAVCLGNFDGVHLGHQALFAKAAAYGPVVAVTFEPHPGKVLQPALAPRLIATRARKLELLEAAGLAAAVVQPFTKDYARTSPEAFEAALFGHMRAAAVVVGFDFTYGRGRAGTVETLGAAAAAASARVAVVPAVTVDGVVVSSSKVREYVLEGRVGAAAKLLGRPFDLDGEVVKGQQRGRTLGFPTANVDTENELRPAAGVYAVRVGLSGGRSRGGAANIGVKPTFDGREVTIECHLFDFEGDLYGQTVRVAFLERLRGEQRFAGVEALRAQIERDVIAARAIVNRP
ncbi:MAG: bifunctional riboflavin kinase/FAD synthetase [Myxococcaceae bacterium]|nr:bifunctional riboflavin kinase/FAD synthetase [Myxococcaceae bacterium]MCA3015517.1 bifunctional riboflavin kinase/FAD synthetase [Myxococcaceae bacterium]